MPVNVTPTRDDTLGATEALPGGPVWARNYLRRRWSAPTACLCWREVYFSQADPKPLAGSIVVGLKIGRFAPGSSLLQRVLWDPRFNQDRRAQKAATKIQNLEQEDQSESPPSLRARRKSIIWPHRILFRRWCYARNSPADRRKALWRWP